MGLGKKRAGLYLVAAILLLIGIGLGLVHLLRQETNPLSNSPNPQASPDSLPSNASHSPANEDKLDRKPAKEPSPREQYRKALQEDDEMRKIPTWEEMRKETPAEF